MPTWFPVQYRMIIQSCRILLMGVVGILPGCQSSSAPEIWKEENHLLIIEAENGLFDPDASAWSIEKEFPGYQGEGYVVWRGAGDWGPEKKAYDSISDPKSIISYWVAIDNPGTYYVKVRNYHLQEDGDNDVWVSVNRGDWGKTYDWQVNAWTLDERGEWAKYSFEKGRHLVQLAGRSEGFAIDQIVIFEQRHKH